MTDPNSNSAFERTRVYRAGIDEVCEQFETSWSENASETIPTLLERVEPELKQTLLKELLLIDIELRKRNGLDTDKNDYLARFSDHPSVVQDAWAQVNQYLKSASKKVDTFTLQTMLGRGGMGEAWKAYDETADRFVVLKFVPKEILHVKEAIDSVRDSFRKVHELQHQHICPVYGLFNNPEYGLYLVMKFIDGLPLDEYKRRSIAKNGKMSFADTIQILWGVAKGLDYAHDKRVIHRDIKPQNIMISKKDGVQIIDFGLAEEIRTSMAKFSQAVMDIAGTRPYMAPEQWMGRLQDARTDQYALAVTAYELFSGHVPFIGSDIGVLRECVLNVDPEPVSGLPNHVNVALMKGLAKKREDRFENCKALIKAMATKPKETALPNSIVSENNPASSNGEINLLSDRTAGETAPPVWQPQTMLSSDGVIATPEIKRKPKWLLPVVGGAVLLLVLSALLLLRPAEEKASKPVAPVAPASAVTQQAQIGTEKTIQPIYARTEPIFPKEIREETDYHKLESQILAYVTKTLDRSVGVFIDGRFQLMGRHRSIPEKFEKIEYIAFCPYAQMIPAFFSPGEGTPCVIPGFKHPSSPCSCSLQVEDLSMLSRLNKMYRLNLIGHCLTYEKLETLGNEFKSSCLHLGSIPELPDWKPLELLSQLLEFSAEDNILRREHLESLASLPKLHNIRLDGSRLTPGAWEPLTGNSSITVLHLHGCVNLDEADWRSIASMKNLHELGLHGTVLTKKELDILATAPKLSKISLGGNGLTKDEIEQFQKKCPKIEIVLPKDVSHPILFSQLPASTREVFLGDLVWESASTFIGSPAARTLESNQGAREKSLKSEAPARVVYRLDKQWNTLESGIGLIKMSAEMTAEPSLFHRYVWSYLHLPGTNAPSVHFIVKGDGKELYRSDLITDSNEQQISVDISGVDTLELIVDDGADGPRFDAAAWFSPKLFRNAAPADNSKQSEIDFAKSFFGRFNGAVQFWVDGKMYDVDFSSEIPKEIDQLPAISHLRFWANDRFPKWMNPHSPTPCKIPGFGHDGKCCSCTFDEETIRRIGQLDQLHELGVPGIRLSIEDLERMIPVNSPLFFLEKGFSPKLAHWKPIERARQLASLVVQGIEIERIHLESVARLPKLRRLIMYETTCLPGCFAPLAGNQTIEELDLARAIGLNQDDLRAIASMKNLKRLDLSCVPLHETGLDLLADLPNGISLKLMDNGITAATLEAFRKKRSDIQFDLKDQGSFPVLMDDIPDDAKETYLTDVLWDSLSVPFGPPGPHTFDFGSGNRKHSLFAPAPSRFVYKLGKKWKTLSTRYSLVHHDILRFRYHYMYMAGKDAPSMQFVVKGDGKEIFRSEMVSSCKERELTLDVSDVETLELIVEDGGDGPRFDAASWITPKLSR